MRTAELTMMVATAGALLLALATPVRAVKADTEPLSSEALRAVIQKGEAEHYPIENAVITAQDAKRKKNFPAFITYPVTKGKLPIIIFSHGLSCGGYDYAYLAQYWAQHGYVCVQPFHEDSLDWNRLRKTSVDCVGLISGIQRNKQAWIERAGDISFIIDALPKLFPKLAGRLDLSRIGVGGHSYGGFITLMLAGAKVPQRDVLPYCDSVCDRRIKAIVSMSVQGVRTQASPMAFDGKSSFTIGVPALFLTGDRDDIGGTVLNQRTDAFQYSPPGNKYYVSLYGANHMTFVGPQQHTVKANSLIDLAMDQVNSMMLEPYGDQEAQRKLVQESTLLFWDAYLKGDAQAKSALHQGGLAALIGKSGETRLK